MDSVQQFTTGARPEPVQENRLTAVLSEASRWVARLLETSALEATADMRTIVDDDGGWG